MAPSPPTIDPQRSSPQGRVLIAICTLNEAENVRSMLGGLRESVPDADLLVVDDDSADGTSGIVTEMAETDSRIRLLVRKGETGLGGAIRRAMEVAVEGDYEYFLNLDADLSHDPRQLPLLLDRMRQPPTVDVVVGSRYVKGGAIDGWPMRRRLMSRTVNGFATVVLRLPVSDCSGSMRCYRVAALRDLGVGTLTSNGYSVLEEVLVMLNRRGSAMAEVPITFTDRVLGESKLTLRETVRSAWRMLTLAVR